MILCVCCSRCSSHNDIIVPTAELTNNTNTTLFCFINFSSFGHREGVLHIVNDDSVITSLRCCDVRTIITTITITCSTRSTFYTNVSIIPGKAFTICTILGREYLKLCLVSKITSIAYTSKASLLVVVSISDGEERKKSLACICNIIAPRASYVLTYNVVEGYRGIAQFDVVRSYLHLHDIRGYAHRTIFKRSVCSCEMCINTKVEFLFCRHVSFAFPSKQRIYSLVESFCINIYSCTEILFFEFDVVCNRFTGLICSCFCHRSSEFTIFRNLDSIKSNTSKGCSLVRHIGLRPSEAYML